MRLNTYCRFPKCERQGGVLAHPAHMADGDAYHLQLLALVSHTTYPHGNGHAIQLEVDGGPVPEKGTCDFRIVCTHPGCDRTPTDMTYRIEPEFAGAVAIAFHAVHEGHGLELYWQGKKIHPGEETK